MMDSTMGAIRLECKYTFRQIDYIHIESEPNKHGCAIIKGSLAGNADKDIIDTLIDRVKIYDTSSNSPLIFSGLVDEVSVRHKGEAYYIEIKALSCSIQMDIAKKRRSFQNKSAPYTELFDKVIVQDSSGGYGDQASGGKAQNRVIIQYDETNWEFIKRVASQLEAVVVPDILSDNPTVYLGLPDKKGGAIDAYEYSLHKQLGEYDKTTRNFTQRPESDYVEYILECDRYFIIGTELTYQGRLLTVARVEIHADKDMIYKRYTLRRRSGIYRNFQKNEAFTGLLIDGTVLDVQSDKIKAHLVIDESQPVGEANWFQWNTAYTSSGQTGLYLMPQKGDTVQLYLPEADENKAYMRTISRSDGASNTKTADTSIKYLGNPYGKELKMAPEELTLTTTAGQMYIKMTDKQGIEIESDKEIQITSEESVTFRGKKIDMSAGEYIHWLAADESSMSMDHITHFKAKKITINGLAKVGADENPWGNANANPSPNTNVNPQMGGEFDSHPLDKNNNPGASEFLHWKDIFSQNKPWTEKEQELRALYPNLTDEQFAQMLKQYDAFHQESRPPKHKIQNKKHWCYATCAGLLAESVGLLSPSKYAHEPHYYATDIESELRYEHIGYDADKKQYYCDPMQEYVSSLVKRKYDNTGGGDAYQALIALAGGGNVLKFGNYDKYYFMDANGNPREKQIKELIRSFRAPGIVDIFQGIEPDGRATSKGHSLLVQEFKVTGDLSFTVKCYDPWNGKPIFFTEQGFVTGVESASYGKGMFPTDFYCLRG